MSTGARPNEAEPAGLPLHRHGQRTAAPAGRPFTFTTRAQTSIQFGFRHTNVYTSLWISKACDQNTKAPDFYIHIISGGASTQVSHTHAQVTRTRTHPARRLVTLRYTPPIPTKHDHTIAAMSYSEFSFIWLPLRPHARAATNAVLDPNLRCSQPVDTRAHSSAAVAAHFHHRPPTMRGATCAHAWP